VLSLRKKVEIDPRQPNLIQTVRNVGYRLNLEILNAAMPAANGHVNRRSATAPVSRMASAPRPRM